MINLITSSVKKLSKQPSIVIFNFLFIIGKDTLQNGS